MAGVNDIEDPYLSNSNDKNHEVVPEKDWDDIDLSDSKEETTEEPEDKCMDEIEKPTEV